MLSQEVFKNGYDVTKNNNTAKKEKNDCFVRACANAFDISYDTAHKFVKDNFNRKKGRGTQNVKPTLREMSTTSFPVEGQLDLFSENGNKHFEITHIGDNKKTGDGRLMNRKSSTNTVSYTVKTFMQKFKTGTYLLLVKKHALVCKNGVIIDNADMQFDGYRRPIESAFLIKETF